MTRDRQKITRKGRKMVVAVSAGELNCKTMRVQTLAEFFARSPLLASGFKVKRLKDNLRSAGL